MTDHVEILDHLYPVKCDFCSSPDVRWSYDCESFIDFVMLAPGKRERFESQDGWAACDACSALIERGAYDELVDRVIGSNPASLGQAPVDRDRARLHLTITYEKFAAYRRGGREQYVHAPGDGLITRTEEP